MKKTITMFTVASAMLFAGVSVRAAETVKGIAVAGPVHATPARPPSGGGSGLTITAISVGTSGFFPCYNCAGGGDVDLPYEQNAIAAGSSMVSTIQMQDTFFVGFPTVNYALLQGGKVVNSGTVTFPFELGPNEEALAYFPETAPTTTGSAQVVMQVLNGSTLVGTSVYNIFIY